jgi:hypothetical protein
VTTAAYRALELTLYLVQGTMTKEDYAESTHDSQKVEREGTFLSGRILLEVLVVRLSEEWGVHLDSI